jgi:hypothetical protein
MAAALRLLPTLLALSTALLAAGRVAAAAPQPGFGEMECQLHKLALRFADRQQPHMGAAPRAALAEALRITQLCGERQAPQPDQPAAAAREDEAALRE